MTTCVNLLAGKWDFNNKINVAYNLVNNLFDSLKYGTLRCGSPRTPCCLIYSQSTKFMIVEWENKWAVFL